MKFRDRVSGTEVDLPPTPTLFGRWIFVGPDAPGVYLNGDPVKAGDALVPGAPGHWALVRPGDVAPVRGRFVADSMPDEQDVSALLDLGRTLLDPQVLRGWLEWSELSPLAPRLDEGLEPHPLEGHIERELEHLREVCCAPQTHIRGETERVLVSRARKIAANAPRWLSAHTEDWSHRTIVGVHPRRILAEIREEQWDLYENRLAARLVDHLVAWLRRRIAEVRRVREGIFGPLESLGSQTATSSTNRHRLERLYRLWGKAYEEQQRIAQKIAEAQKRLEQLLYAVLELMDSPLYRKVPRRAQVPRSLKMTNLLSNDKHYRGLTRLWHQWSHLVVPRAPSARELNKRHQHVHKSFVAWSVLVTVRALEQLRVTPKDDTNLERPLRPGQRIDLVDDFSLEWDEAWVITLSRDGEVVLRVVPLAHGLDRAPDSEALRARLSPLLASVVNATHWTVVLHPAVLGGRDWDAVAGVGSPPQPGTPGAIDFVRVSPFALDSVERVARAVRWAVLAPRMLAYPPKLEVVEGFANISPTLIRMIGKSIGALLRLPERDEERLLDLRTCIREAEAKQAELATNLNSIDEALHHARGDPRRTSKLNQQKRKIRRPIDEATALTKRLNTTSTQLARAMEQLSSLIRCPLCSVNGGFDAHDNNCFEVRCDSPSCGAVWGLRRDRSARVPFLLPGGVDSKRWPKTAPPQWVDDQLGSDVLAIPQSAGEDVTFSMRMTRESGQL